VPRRVALALGEWGNVLWAWLIGEVGQSWLVGRWLALNLFFLYKVDGSVCGDGVGWRLMEVWLRLWDVYWRRGFFGLVWCVDGCCCLRGRELCWFVRSRGGQLVAGEREIGVAV